MLCGSLRLFHSRAGFDFLAKTFALIGRLGAKHLQPEAACVDCFGIAKQEPLGEALEVTLKTSPGMLVCQHSCISCFRIRILLAKIIKMLGTTCLPRFCCH